MWKPLAQSSLTELIGNSTPMQALRAEIASAAQSQAKVLIVGETGSGKEVVAQLIHAQGVRRHAAYVRDLPTSPDDFTATVLHAFGIEPDTLIQDTLRRPLPVTTGRPLTRLFG